MTLTSQDQQRITVLNQLLAGDMSTAQAAQLMGKSERQIYRWKASYRQEGLQAVIHGNRGKRSPRRIDEATRQQVVKLAQTRYVGCNQHHLRDLLEEREQISISRASLRRILQEAGVLVVTPAKKAKHRLRRPRYRQEGQLVQIDASPHAWLQDRGPRMSLVGGIDDATGKVVGAIFREQEDQQGYFQIIEQMVQRYGCPHALYHDRHTMFPARRQDATQQDSVQAQLRGAHATTQLGRLFTQLQIRSIPARSPQAKGRIERLWGTFQDRLVSELRIAGISTLQDANAFLQEFVPRFNARFAVPASEPELAWQAFPEAITPQECFCWQHERTVSSDNTISYQGRRLQLLPSTQRRSWARCKVVVYEQYDGVLSVRYQDQWIAIRSAPADPVSQREAVSSVSAFVPTEQPVPEARSKAHVPKADHPWRKRVVASS